MRQPDDELAQRQQSGLLRQLRPIHSAQGTKITLANGRVLRNFGSNDYLSLATHPQLIKAAQAELENTGTGSGSARLICGSLSPHNQLEQALALAKQSEAALVFSTGYATALGTLSGLATKGDTIIVDKLCHASLIDGARLSGATIRVFPHNNLEKLERLLASSAATSSSRTIVVIESVYSMDGDLAPLPEIVALKEKYGAWLLVDEAHAFGLCGPKGMGLAEELGLQDRIELQMGTFSKAAGSAGGYIAASQDIVDLLTNSARSFIYSTAPPPAQSAASLAALELIQSQEGQKLRTKLRSNIAALGISPTSQSPIIPIVVGDTDKALALTATLAAEGDLVPAIRYPTVPRQQARLRLSLSAAHTPEDIISLHDRLMTHLASLD